MVNAATAWNAPQRLHRRSGFRPEAREALFSVGALDFDRPLDDKRMSTDNNPPKDQSHLILNSWKEIASYFGRGVRTVQRWEQELQLPVHRIGKGKRSPVFAVASELKFWMVTSAGRNALKIGAREGIARQSDQPKREAQLAARLHQLAQAVAESSVRHQRNAEALQKNILALKSRFSSRKSK